MALSLVPTLPRPDGLRGGLIASVVPESAAAKAGIAPGDRLLAINGHPLRDLIDYRFYSADDAPCLELEGDGIRYQRRLAGGDLGLNFEAALFDGVRLCNNDCFFCFIAGLPSGARPSLRLKDDDYRLSFLFGNFITLTNLSPADWARLAEQRLSPLYISVHTTDAELRRQMLANPQAPDILEQLRRLGALGIQVHAQVVLCPGVNDGPNLEQTVADLATLYPTVASVAVVPVGVTEAGRHRAEGRSRKGAFSYPQPMTQDQARAVLRQIRPWQRRFRRQWGVSFIHAADEFYLLAGEPLPSTTRYDGFPQLENGVGLIRRLLDDWARQKRRLKGAQGEGRSIGPGRPKRLTIACGTLIAPLLADMVSKLNQIENLMVELAPLPNRFFGPTVTVSGLLTGSDLIAGLAAREPSPRRVCPGELVVISRSALDSSGKRFLDDLTPSQVEERLGVKLAFVTSPQELMRLIWGDPPTEIRR